MGRLATKTEIVSPNLFAIVKRSSIASVDPLWILVKTLLVAIYHEIAEVLGISESNVGVRLNRARASLRKLMGEGP